MTLSQLSTATNQNVIGALQHENVCYHLLIEGSNGFWLSYYVEGQKMGITLKGPKPSGGRVPFKKRPSFKSNID